MQNERTLLGFVMAATLGLGLALAGPTMWMLATMLLGLQFLAELEHPRGLRDGYRTITLGHVFTFSGAMCLSLMAMGALSWSITFAGTGIAALLLSLLLRAKYGSEQEEEKPATEEADKKLSSSNSAGSK